MIVLHTRSPPFPINTRQLTYWLPKSGLSLISRYVLWALSRYSQGSELSTFLKAQKPAKKFRG